MVVDAGLAVPSDASQALEAGADAVLVNTAIAQSLNPKMMGNAFKLGTELVAAVGVGTIIGFILDSWFGTKPWLIIIFFFLGAAAGMLNVIRAANRMQKEE